MRRSTGCPWPLVGSHYGRDRGRPGMGLLVRVEFQAGDHVVVTAPHLRVEGVGTEVAPAVGTDVGHPLFHRPESRRQLDVLAKQAPITDCP